jgi:PPK2 family polyphosphate:nucleotide phosphotransferase
VGRKKIAEDVESFIEAYRFTKGKDFRLEDCDPGDTAGVGSEDKPKAKELLARGVSWLAEAQAKLYAQNQWAVLLEFQAMDAAGKDSTIKHVMSGVNPQGVQVYSFKQPSTEELDHDFMWRSMRCLPERGRIGIFNRSYYEEVLVVRVHPELLQHQHLPKKLITPNIWEERLEDIAAFERYLARQGVVILKFFLNVSRKEQKRRFLDRLDEQEKNWKFSSSDVKERGFWKDYQHAYERAIRATASKHAPWYVVPADNKWFTRVVVAASIVDALNRLDLKFPKVDEKKKRELAGARAALEKE